MSETVTQVNETTQQIVRSTKHTHTPTQTEMSCP